MRPFIALLAGVLFGIGLLLADMTNPAKVLGFLDLAGQWDPSLAFVMLGAIAVAFLPFRWAGKRSQSLLGAPMQLPTSRTLDKRLIGGSLLFGIGWGIAGLCPGPSVALLLTLQWQPLVFMLSMLAGMLIFQALENRSKR
ncbi:YeeE/YedE family protein [Pseudomonas cichorii]|nr:YeeE/YedE family protein [Pseudomonas cichorii]